MLELKHHNHNCNAVKDLVNNVTAGNTQNDNLNYNDPEHWLDGVSKSLLGKSVINDWKHAHKYLQSYKNSVYYLEYLKK